jgi:hypothetical protein
MNEYENLIASKNDSSTGSTSRSQKRGRFSRRGRQSTLAHTLPFYRPQLGSPPSSPRLQATTPAMSNRSFHSVNSIQQAAP